MTKGPQTIPEPQYRRWGDTAAAAVDTSGMGGEDTPFIQTATMVEQPFLIHSIRHIETKYGPRWLLVIQKWHTLDLAEKDARFAMTFSELSPVALELQTLQDEFDMGARLPETTFPLLTSMVRQGKSYRLVDWDTEHNRPALPF